MTDIQIRAKKILDQWLSDQNVTLSEFSKSMGYQYAYAWTLVRGKAMLSDDFIGRMLKTYGPEAAQLISDALNGEPARNSVARDQKS